MGISGGGDNVEALARASLSDRPVPPCDVRLQKGICTEAGVFLALPPVVAVENAGGRVQ